VHITNLTPTSTGAVTITVNIDPTLTYLSATPTPTTVNGNTLTWNQASLGAWQERQFGIFTMVPPDINLLGIQLSSNATLTTANTDGDLTNNTTTNLRTITGAYDPNDKLAYSSSGNTSVWQINEDEWIDYTIRFQNTGTDTAFTVIVTDTLPSTLDPGSIVWGAASHTTARALEGQGILTFTFANILLPDSNVNEAASHGLVSFRIKPHLPILPGTEIENVANIYFDYNPPVITDPSVLVAELSTGVVQEQRHGQFHLFPNPARDYLRVNVSTGDLGLIAILTLDGRVVKTLFEGGSSTEFDVSDLRPGAYIVEVQSNTTHRTRFVKQ